MAAVRIGRTRTRPTGARLDALRATPELSSCSETDLDRLARQADEVRVPANRQLAAEGQACRQYFVVLEGRLSACSAGGGCRVLGAGQAVGWAAMWERSANDETVVTESDTTLLVMGHAQFRAAKALTSPPTMPSD